MGIFQIKEYKHIISTTAQEMDATENEMKTIKTQIEKDLSDYEKKIVTDEERQLYNSIKEEWGKYLQVNAQIIPLSRELKTEEAMNLMRNQSLQAFKKASSELVELVKYNREHGKKASMEGKENYARARLLLGITIPVAALIAFVAAYFMSRSISNPLKEIEGAAKQVAKGDLTADSIQLRNKDEIGSLANSFNIMKDNLKDLIKKIAVSANSLNETASVLAAQAQQTSNSASENAATMGEIASTVEQVASNCSCPV